MTFANLSSITFLILKAKLLIKVLKDNLSSFFLFTRLSILIKLRL